MSSSWPKPGVKSVGEYQISGVPFVVASATAARVIELDYVSSAITFISTVAGATVHFYDVNASDAAQNTVVKLPLGAMRVQIRCKKFAISNDQEVGAIVELTGVEPLQMPLPLRAGTVT
jgi:hypothetical protein